MTLQKMVILVTIPCKIVRQEEMTAHKDYDEVMQDNNNTHLVRYDLCS